jgi:flagellin-like protein
MRAAHRAGVSEVMAAVMTIAITLIAGFALFGYINGQAAASENKLGAAAGGNANFLAEKFVVVQMSFSTTCTGPSPTCAIIWVYNNGQLGLGLQWIHLYNGTKTANNIPIDVTYTGTTGSSTLSGTCGTGTEASPDFLFDLPPLASPTSLNLFLPSGCSFTTGTTYYVNVLAQFGNQVVYYAVK